jgi:hypothetical protein
VKVALSNGRLLGGRGWDWGSLDGGSVQSFACVRKSKPAKLTVFNVLHTMLYVVRCAP